jgi:signal transduction histidine kinase
VYAGATGPPGKYLLFNAGARPSLCIRAPRRFAIRHRLLTIVLLGVITSALSLCALMRAIWMLSSAHRAERARDAVVLEATRLAAMTPAPGALASGAGSTLIAVRGGWVEPSDHAALAGLPGQWQQPVARALAEAEARRQTVTSETALQSAQLEVAVVPATGDRLAFAAYLLAPSASLLPWRWIALGLGTATALLVASAVAGAISLRRSTAALHTTLVALGKDLTTPVPDPRIAELVGIASGIRRLAADLVASREDTERLGRELANQERLAALGRVAAGVAHEVRNPLASIKLRLDLTCARPGLPEAARQAVEAASQEIARLDRLVGDLLLVAGKKMGPRRSAELGALLRERTMALEAWAQTQKVALRADGEGAAEVDVESLARAVDNLLRNAVEASPPGAVVRAQVARQAGGVEITVEDAGPGVERTRVRELFEPFFTTKADGTGLGLAISRAIARAHGGDLTYARSGGLTRFTLSLPQAAARPEAAA